VLYVAPGYEDVWRGGGRPTSLRIFSLSTGYIRMAIFTHQLLYRREKASETQWIGWCVGTGSGLDNVKGNVWLSWESTVDSSVVYLLAWSRFPVRCLSSDNFTCLFVAVASLNMQLNYSAEIYRYVLSQEDDEIWWVQKEGIVQNSATQLLSPYIFSVYS